MQKPIALFFSAWWPGGLTAQKAFLNSLFWTPSIAEIIEPTASKIAFLLPGDNIVSPSKKDKPSLGKELSTLDDRGKMKSYLSKIKRKINKKTIKIDRVMKDYDNLIKIYKKKAKWLNKADTELRSKLETLLNETSNTIGARSQQKLPRETALFIAKCNSDHKDISLNF